MTEITTSDLENVIGGIVGAANAELKLMTKADLERYWHFRWNGSASLEANLYEFHDLLDLYGDFCRRWEELHNGRYCIVERVRDTYLMPKIRAFADQVRAVAVDKSVC